MVGKASAIQIYGHGSGQLVARRPVLRGSLIIPSAMRAYVYVSLKKTVLDPQGKTIQSALRKMGYGSVGDVRQGKYFEIALDGADRAQAEQQVQKIAKEVLTNPVIEEFSYRLEE